MNGPTVALVSPWRVQCGIATYTEELVERLQDTGLQVRVLAEHPHDQGRAGVAVPAADVIEGVWSRRNPAAGAFIARAAEGCDVVHFQHEHGLWPLRSALFQAMRDVKQRGAKVVATLHTVRPYGNWEETGFLDSVRRLADLVIVHTTSALASAVLAEGDARVVHIPHGTRPVGRVGDRLAGLKLLKVPARLQGEDVVFGGIFGFVGPSKRVHVTLQAFATALARRLMPSIGLIICGRPGGDTPEYPGFLESLCQRSGYTNHVIMHFDFVPREDVRHVMAALDFGVLNTDSWSLSASGQVHLHAAHGVPLAVANRPIYQEAIEAGAIPFDVAGDHDVTDSMVNTIAALGRDAGVRDHIKKRLLAYASATSWERVAEELVKCYRTLVEQTTGS